MEWIKLKAYYADNKSDFARVNISLLYEGRNYFFLRGIRSCHGIVKATNFRLFQTERVCRQQFQI